MTGLSRCVAASFNKRAYAYLFTQKGVEEKARMTLTFLLSKMQEYERLHIEVEELKNEAQRLSGKRETVINVGENV